MGILVEGIPQEGFPFPGDPLHLPGDRRAVCLWVMPFHLFGPEEGHPLVEPLVAGLDGSALDNNGNVPLVVCDGCEVIEAGIQYHDAGRLPVRADDVPLIRDQVPFRKPVVRDYLQLKEAEIRDGPYFDQFVPRRVREARDRDAAPFPPDGPSSL